MTWLGCLFYEQSNREEWQESWRVGWVYQQRCIESHGQNCPDYPIAQVKPDFTVFMVKYLMFLIVGITSGFWIWSSKTIYAWQKFYFRVKQRFYGPRGNIRVWLYWNSPRFMEKSLDITPCISYTRRASAFDVRNSITKYITRQRPEWNIFHLDMVHEIDLILSSFIKRL